MPLHGFQGDGYAAAKTWVRFFVPYEHYHANRLLFSQRVGHLKVQNPHRDSWVTNPLNALVLWIALSPVRPGNGMLFYPDLWDRTIPHDGYEQRGFRIARQMRLGRPLNVRLDPGDMLLFSGEHLHSSELNRTDATRYVLSFRMSLSPPRYGEGNRWVAYNDLRMTPKPWAWMRGWRCRLTKTYVRFLLQRRLGYWLRQKLSRDARGLPAADRNAVHGQIETNRQGNPGVVPEFSATDLNSLRIGEIVPVSDAYCVARTEQGVFVFSRFCPHEGADLAGADLKGDHLYCPWHNLRFDLPTGTQACRSLANLDVFRVDQLSGKMVKAHRA